jgi:hypothetical protein
VGSSGATALAVCIVTAPNNSGIIKVVIRAKANLFFTVFN